MPTYHIRAKDFRGIERELKQTLHQHSKERAKRIKAGIAAAAVRGKTFIADTTIPVAFTELVDSLFTQAQSDGHRIGASAPHAAAVENGSRPHKPPLGPLIEWVRLRGMQGLKSSKQLRKLRGSTTRTQAKSIAQLINARERNGAVPVDAPEQIARAIQYAIMKRGTRPHFFMGKAVPIVSAFFVEEVLNAVPDP